MHLATGVPVRDAALLLGLACCGCYGTSHPDAGVEGGPDAPIDAASADAFVPAFPVLHWRAEDVGTCPVVPVPVFAPPPGERPLTDGSVRWVRDRVVSGLAPPALLTSGTSMQSEDLHRWFPVDYQTGDLGPSFILDYTVPSPEPGERNIFRYGGPFLSLRGDVVVSRTPWQLLAWQPGFVAGEVWPIPEIDWLRNEERDADWGMLELDHSLLAFSPVTGHVAAAVGLGTALVAVRCPGVDGGTQYVIDFRHLPRQPPYRTVVYFRENGELIVFYDRVWVFSPSGELLREVDLGVNTEPPIAYDRTCGLLLKTGRRRYVWLDVDSMAPRVTLEPTFSHSVAMGTYECGALLVSGDGFTTVRPDQAELRLAPAAARVTPTRTGYLVALPTEGRAEVLRFDGSTERDFPTTWDGTAAITPTGSALGHDSTVFGDARWELGIDASGCLARDCGLNWAHTNSPIPE